MSTTRADTRGVVRPCPQCGAAGRIPFAHLPKTGRCTACGAAFPPPDAPVEVPDAAAFDALVVGAAAPVLVDFWAPWCGPCRMVAPVLEDLARRHAGRVVVAKVDTDAMPDPAARHGIRSIPTLILFVEGRAAGRLTGARPAAEIEAFLRQAA